MSKDNRNRKPYPKRDIGRKKDTGTKQHKDRTGREMEKAEWIFRRYKESSQLTQWLFMKRLEVALESGEIGDLDEIDVFKLNEEYG